MDTITQAILGASIAEAGWRRKLGSGAIFLGIAGGVLPDLDIASALMGPWGSMLYHRSFTHSLLFAPLVAPLIGFLAWKWTKKKESYFSWMNLAFWSIITHPLLDIFTSYGTQLFYPFSHQRIALDGVSVIDPLYTIPLLFALWVGYKYRQRPNIGRAWSQIMLVLTTGYLFFGYAQSAKAEHYVALQLKQTNFVATEIRATPTLLNIWLWRVMARNKKGDIWVGLLSTLSPQPIQFMRYPHPNHPLIKKALASDKAKLFQWFASNMVSVHLQKNKDLTNSVILRDQRYGLISNLNITFWAAKIDFDKKEKITHITKIRRSKRHLSVSKELSVMFHFIFKGKAPKSF